MNEEEREILQRAYPAFLKDLEPNEVLPHLIAAGHITHGDYEDVKNKVTSQLLFISKILLAIAVSVLCYAE